MKVQVKFFARAKDVVGADEITLDLGGDGCNGQATIGDIRAALTQQYDGLKPMAGSLLFAIDTDYVQDSAPISSDSTVVCFPP